jgi:hypothetical protein
LAGRHELHSPSNCVDPEESQQCDISSAILAVRSATTVQSWEKSVLNYFTPLVDLDDVVEVVRLE